MMFYFNKVMFVPSTTEADTSVTLSDAFAQAVAAARGVLIPQREDDREQFLDNFDLAICTIGNDDTRISRGAK